MFRRDCLLYIRHPADVLASLGFFALMISLFLILFGGSPQRLQAIGPALVWMAILLSVLINIEVVLRSDYQAAVLDHLLLSQYPLALLCFAKILAHMCVMGLPLLLLTPVVGLLFHFNTASVLALVFSVALGIPSMSLIGSVGAALTLGLERGAWLVMLLVLPLLLPLLLVGTHAVMQAAQDLSYHADLLLLGALCVLSIVSMPMLMALSVRVSLE